MEAAANGNHTDQEEFPEPTVPSKEFLLAAAMEAKEPALARDSAQKRKAASAQGAKVVPRAPKARPPQRRRGFARLVRDYQVYLAAAGVAIVSAGAVGYSLYGGSYFE